ncbi:hypothetical protein GTW43_13790 [Streptomyces sp. SID5785]|uniref:hypothetical protein n=1 Tax=Streptomyces sp. SID5785 TaxID=2690309 RepID=UPI0013618C2F|nr:hypothetical protein [Streptomyces sp. SID5785]MZD06155.1 hypothetical protein [Streptomyces sp. SID5785]
MAPARRTPPAGPAEPFGPLQFQLVLLRRMADHNPGLVETARADLGVTVAEMREANRRWQAMLHAPRSRAALSRYRSVLGTPEQELTRPLGDLSCTALLWPVPLWPDLRFEVLLAPTGAVWNAWLVRAPGAPGPALRTLADLAPWSCTVDEAARAFAPARPLEGSAPTRWGLECSVPAEEDTAGAAGAAATAGTDGTPRRVRAEFTWGLLQRWTEV